MSMYKAQQEAELRNHVTAALQVAFKEVLKSDLIFKVTSSTIMHTRLQPEGDTFAIRFQIEVHKKEKKDVPADTPA